MEKSPQIHDSWRGPLAGEFELSYMKDLKSFLKERLAARATIYPKGSEYFAALNTCPLESVKVVVLGQDPYHGPGQAHGLSFSVREGTPPPPSLMNIFKELRDDVGAEHPGHGHLLEWAEQGVLLLNSVLTVEQGLPGSHAGKGWERFTDKIISVINDRAEPTVFFLWGAYAQKKGAFIDRKRHLVVSTPHPSPLSAHRGFFGSRPFSKANEFLRKHQRGEIRWQLRPAAKTGLSRDQLLEN